MTNTIKSYVLSRVMPANAVVFSENNTTPTEIPTGDVYTKYVFAGSELGEFKNVGIDLINTQSVILKKGKYLIECSFSSFIDKNNVVFDTVVLVNDLPISNLHIRRLFIGVGGTSNGNMSGLVDLERGDTVAIGVKHNNAGNVNITTEFSSLLILKV